MIYILWAIFGAIAGAVYLFGFKAFEYQNYRDTQRHNLDLAEASAIATFIGLCLGNLATIFIYEVIFCV